jgi:hypothetical protein
MKREDIKSISVKNDGVSKQLNLLEGEIDGATVLFYQTTGIQSFDYAPSSIFSRVFFLLDGDATFSDNLGNYSYSGKAVYIPNPRAGFSIQTNTPSKFLEIKWDLNTDDWKEIDNNQKIFPFTAKYEDSIQYKEDNKGANTIQRAVVPQRVLPRFALGTVETIGEDILEKSEHPLLDQFYFSLEKNDITVLIDDIEFHLQEDTLLHIPLGSNHGARVDAGKRANYIWIDFILNEEGVAFLDEIHKVKDKGD